MPPVLYKSVNDLLIPGAMHVEAQALVVAVRAHGEHGAVVRALTEEHGLLAGYVRGGRSRRLRPVLMPGNRVRGVWRARIDTQLAALTVELIDGRAALMDQPLGLLALEWTTALVAATLPEGQRYARVFAALDGMLIALESAPSARGWLPALVRFEQVVLAELGYGIDRVETDTLDALRRNGERLARDLLTERRVDTLAARERLIERLTRTVS